MKIFSAVLMVLMAGQTEAENLDPQLKLQRILNKFSVIADSTVGRVRNEYSRMDIKKQRIQAMGSKMLKNFAKINGKCIFFEFEDDEQDVR